MFKKIIALFCLLAIMSVPVLVSAANEERPRVVIQKPKMSGPLNVYMFYDTQAEVICYATSTGQALACFSFTEVSSRVADRLSNLVENWKRNNPGQKVPSVMVIPGN